MSYLEIKGTYSHHEYVRGCVLCMQMFSHVQASVEVRIYSTFIEPALPDDVHNLCLALE